MYSKGIWLPFNPEKTECVRSYCGDFPPSANSTHRVLVGIAEGTQIHILNGGVSQIYHCERNGQWTVVDDLTVKTPLGGRYCTSAAAAASCCYVKLLKKIF